MRLLHHTLTPWTLAAFAPDIIGGAMSAPAADAAPAEAAPAADAAPAGDEAPAGADTTAGTDTVAGDESGADTVAGADGADSLSGDDTKTGDESGDDTQTGADMIGAPEGDYVQFEMPEGFTFDADAMALAAPVLKELNISQTGAQALVSKLYIPLMQQAAAAADKAALDGLAAQKTAWLQEAQAHEGFKALGGWNKGMTLAARARDSFGSPELNELLDDSGLGNHASVILAFAKAGAAMADDDFERGTRVVDTKPKDAGEVFYGDSMKRKEPA